MQKLDPADGHAQSFGFWGAPVSQSNPTFVSAPTSTLTNVSLGGAVGVTDAARRPVVQIEMVSPDAPAVQL